MSTEYAFAMPRLDPDDNHRVCNFDIGEKRWEWLRKRAFEQRTTQTAIVCEALDKLRDNIERRGPDGKFK